MLGSGYQGSTYLYEGEVNGERLRLVIKRAAEGRLTGWLHRRMLRREARAYQRMAGVRGVPHSPGLLDDRWLLLEYVEGESLMRENFEQGEREAFYAQFLQILHDIHAAGVSHGDLKRKENILVTPDGQPRVIDFGTAVMRDGSLWDLLLFRFVRRLDYHAWIKAKYHSDYSAISADDQRWYRPTLAERSFRVLQRFLRKVSLRRWRKRRRKRKAQRAP